MFSRLSSRIFCHQFSFQNGFQNSDPWQYQFSELQHALDVYLWHPRLHSVVCDDSSSSWFHSQRIFQCILSQLILCRLSSTTLFLSPFSWCFACTTFWVRILVEFDCSYCSQECPCCERVPREDLWGNGFFHLVIVREAATLPETSIRSSLSTREIFFFVWLVVFSPSRD